MRKLIIYILSFGLLLLGLMTNANAITFGEPDGGLHPHVGTLLFVQNGVGYFSCTGTLISPTEMLTAGHCTEGGGLVNDVTYVRFEENALAGIGSYATTQEWLDAEWILADSVIPHPQYDDYAMFPDTFDVGLVILSEPVDLDSYGELPDEGLLEEVLAERGNSTNWWTVVGYGSQGVIKPFAGDDYARYNATTRLIEINSTFNGSGSAKFTNNPGKGQGGNSKGGACFGDSGGPVFYQDTAIIGAVVSWGLTPCIGMEFQFRIDTLTALDFIYSELLP